MSNCDPFFIDGPALISFSGGRTSGYMLHRILDAHGGILPPDVHVLFADTGKERAETYAFVKECARRWSINITWVTRPGQFTQLITDKKALPSPLMRWCTADLKVAPMHKWMRVRGYESWTNVMGLRADEARRVAKMRGIQGLDVSMPLADAGIVERDIAAYWQASDFDLGLRKHEGNCDLCMLKGAGILKRLIRDNPESADWWIEQERRTGWTFRKHAGTYESLKAAALAQGSLFEVLADEDDSQIDCFCTD